MLNLKCLPAKVLLAYCMLSAFHPSTASAASFDVLKEEGSGDWRSVLYRNQRDGREFCAYETVMHGTYLRLNRYKDNEETFLEVYNPEWTIGRGKKVYFLAFNNGKETIEADLSGDTWGNSFTFEISNEQTFETLVSFFVASKTLALKNEKGEFIEEFYMTGAGEAANYYLKCLMD